MPGSTWSSGCSSTTRGRTAGPTCCTRTRCRAGRARRTRTPSGSATWSSAPPRRAPRRSSSTATWCSPSTRAPTRCPTSRSRRARSSEPGRRAPRAVSTTSSCSTCRAAASPRTSHAGWWSAASSARSCPRSHCPSCASAWKRPSRPSWRSPAPEPHHTEHPTDMSTLEIKDLHVSVATEDGAKEILRGVDLTVRSGETHAIMGPNGSGKSTLAYSLAGHPKYTVTSGEVLLDGEDVLAMSVDARARAGLFLAMQYPVEIPGVTVSNFLRTAKTAIDGAAPKLRDFMKNMRKAMADLSIDPAFAERNLNEGFSGGEKKRHEILQLDLLNPKIAVLDETDSGLDVDALKVVSEGATRNTEEK